MLNKNIFVRDCSAIKQGKTKDGRDWTLYKVVDSDGIEYTDFNPYQMGQSYEINYIEESYTDRNGVIKPQRKIVPSKQVAKVEAAQKAQGQMDRIEQKLDDIIKLLLNGPTK